MNDEIYIDGDKLSSSDSNEEDDTGSDSVRGVVRERSSRDDETVTQRKPSRTTSQSHDIDVKELLIEGTCINELYADTFILNESGADNGSGTE